MLQTVEIPFPMRGLDFAQAADKQNPLTTKLAVNVRGIDPRTGRMRGSQRSGWRRWIDPEVPEGVDNPQALCQVPYDRVMTTYSVNETAGDVSVEWSADKGPDAIPACFSIAVAGTGDVYWLNGSRWLIKTNPNGVQVSQVQIPVSFESETGSVVAVGSDGAVYVGTQTGVSASGEPRFAGRVFRYEASPSDPNRLTLAWTYDAGGGVADLVEDFGTLYVGVNRGANSAVLLVLNSLLADPPNLASDRPIPAPVAKLTVNSQGEILVASQRNPARDDVPAYTLCGTKTVDWEPEPGVLLAEVLTGGATTLENRAWLRSESIAGVTENQFIDFWNDDSGNGRHAYAMTGGGAGLLPTQFKGTRGARFVRDALCGFPAARFDGSKDGEGRVTGLGSGTGGDRWMPTANQRRAFFYSMVVKFRSSAEDRGIILQDQGKPFHTLNQQPDPRFFALSLDYPMGKVPNPSDPDNRALDRIRTAALTPNGYTDDPDTVAIITVALDPTTDGATGVRMGSFVRVNGKMVGWNELNAGLVGGALIDQFTAERVGGEASALLLGCTPFADEPGNYDLIEAVWIEGKYLWPTDANLGYITGGAFPAGRNPSSAADGKSQIEKVEGYLAHKYGIQQLLDRPAGYPAWGTPAAHPYRTAPAVGPGASTPTTPVAPVYEERLRSENGIVSKYQPGTLKLLWAVQGPGLGFGVVAGEDDAVWSVGLPAIDPWVPNADPGFEEPANANAAVRRLKDNGASVVEIGTDTFAVTNADLLVYKGLQMAVDGEKNLYFAGLSDGSTPPVDDVLWKYRANGTLEWLFGLDGFFVSSGHGLALDPIRLDYGEQDIKEPEFLYLGVWGNKQLHKIRLVDAAYELGSPRRYRVYAINDGTIQEASEQDQTITTITGGAAALNSASKVVFPAVVKGEMFVTDGERYVVVDPKKNTVAEWRPRTAGQIPRRGRLLEVWRDRAVVGRADGSPYDLFMSAVGDPYDWDTDPPELLATSACSIRNTRAGMAPDIVNCIIPYSDDLLIIGGDKTIQRLTGDPLASDSAIDLVTNSVGIAFGRPWCQDHRGRVWFMGTDGGVYVMSPPNKPDKISSPRLDRFVDTIDLAHFSVRMAYDHVQRGITIMFVPIDPVFARAGAENPNVEAGADPVLVPDGAYPAEIDDEAETDPSLFWTGPTYRQEANFALVHWFYEFDTDGWFMDVLADPTLDPHAMIVLNGDKPQDRRILIYSADGFIRTVDPFQSDDDGLAIKSIVRCGPLVPRAGEQKARWQNFHGVTSVDTTAMTMRLLGADSVEGSLRGHDAITLGPGRNRGVRKRISGGAVYVDLGLSDVGHWSIERLTAQVTTGGRIRSGGAG
jgi:hypothetical protein